MGGGSGHFGGVNFFVFGAFSAIGGVGRSNLAILNADDERVARMANRTAARVVTYGFDPDADVTAEEIVSRYGISRADQDAFAAESQRRAEVAVREFPKYAAYADTYVTCALRAGRTDAAVAAPFSLRGAA